MRPADPKALNVGIREMLAKVEGVVPEALACHKIRGQPRDSLKEKVGRPPRLFAAALARQGRRKSRRPPKTFFAAARLRLRETIANDMQAVDWTPPAPRPVDAAT